MFAVNSLHGRSAIPVPDYGPTDSRNPLRRDWGTTVLMSTESGTIPEAADRLQVSVKTIRRMIARGEIPARRIGARMIRVDMSALEDIGEPI